MGDLKVSKKIIAVCVVLAVVLMVGSLMWFDKDTENKTYPLRPVLSLQQKFIVKVINESKEVCKPSTTIYYTPPIGYKIQQNSVSKLYRWCTSLDNCGSSDFGSYQEAVVGACEYSQYNKRMKQMEDSWEDIPEKKENSRGK
jgi:hypothetical protein